ncbi:MAG: hypothetical protein MMC33_004294 [Icmadophila ericetorum]|nr:hypothetical protein [Icmadophila ericetorum]
MTREYVLLDEPISRTWVDRLLGSVVVNPARPLDEFVPNLSDDSSPRSTKDILPDICDEKKKIFETHEKQRLSVVTGFLTAQELRYKREQTKDWAGGLGLWFPLGQWIGLPWMGAGDTGVKVQVSKDELASVKAEIDEEIIFAIDVDDTLVDCYFKKSRPAHSFSKKPKVHTISISLGENSDDRLPTDNKANDFVITRPTVSKVS